MKTALITGANRGMGREVARQLARRGVHVFLGVRRAAAGAETAATIRAEGGTVTELALWSTAPPLTPWPGIADATVLDDLGAPLCTAYIGSCP